ncbi:MAG TPA: hypothetical protein VNO43_16785 [Candidatus Eisenbacteria bacterium]|nr:hypothetical protein [Candidatus Eisenbacteria bacterium]
MKTLYPRREGRRNGRLGAQRLEARYRACGVTSHEHRSRFVAVLRAVFVDALQKLGYLRKIGLNTLDLFQKFAAALPFFLQVPKQALPI